METVFLTHKHLQADSVEQETNRKSENPPVSKNPNRILFLAFLYFAFMCGLEGFFQSQTYTFALCGPHHFSPQQAALLTTIYFSRSLYPRL